MSQGVPRLLNHDTQPFVLWGIWGIDSFVEYETLKKIRNVLARLIANGDKAKAQEFLVELVEKL